MDAVLALGAAVAWATLLWFYGRAEYREPQWRYLILLTLGCTACFWLPWVGWLVALLIQYVVLRRHFDFPAPAARFMSIAVLAIYIAVQMLFTFAGPPAPPL